MQAINIVRQWTSKQALILVTACLALGIAGGWLIRGFQAPPAQAANASSSAPSSISIPKGGSQQPSPTSLKQAADTQAAPLLAKLNANSKDPDTLSAIGNLYYDAQQYSTAVDYYSRALQSRPSDASVRTDMATAYWYMGNSEEAIAQFNKALVDAPTNPNTLFNLGLVKWKARHDSAGAIANWKKLLEANPNYEQRDKVRQMLSDLEKQTTAQTSTKG